MALIECHECSKEISDSASTCPACGAPVRAKQHKKGGHPAAYSGEDEAQRSLRPNERLVMHG